MTELISVLRVAWRAPFRFWLGALDRLVEAGQGQFVLFLPVCMGAGALSYLTLRHSPPLWAGAACAAIAAAGFRLAGERPVPRFLFAAIAMAGLGFASGQLAEALAPPLLDLPMRAVAVEGVVRGVDLLPEGGRRLVLDSARLGPDAPVAPRYVRVRLKEGDDQALAVGDHVQVRALMRPPAPPTYPGAWDLQRDAFFTGLGGGGIALGPVQVLAEARPSGLARHLRRLRDTVAARIIAALPGTEGAIAATLMTGISGAIPEADRAAFRDSGLAHLLAVAGLHIGIVMGLFLGLSRTLLGLSERALLHWPCKTIGAIAALTGGGVYLLMTGAHVPIMRSFAMACLFTLGVVLGRRSISLRGLGLAGVAILCIAPWEIGGVSFQMSFAAVLALIAGYEALRPRLQAMRGDGGRGRRFALHVTGLALTSALAGTASAPFAAYHFGRVQSYFILANLLAVPLTALWVMPLGLAALALMPLGLEAYSLTPMGWGIAAILWIGRQTSALPGAVWLVPHMPGLGLIVLALGMGWLGIWRGRWRLLGVVPIAAGLVSPWLAVPPDILISPDARLIAFRAGGAIYAEAAGSGQTFVRDSWAAFYGVAEMQKLPAVGEAASGAVNCDVIGCLLAPSVEVKPALLLRRGGSFVAEDCAQAAVLIAAEPVRYGCDPAVPVVVDRFTVWREGAAAIWLTPQGAAVVTDRDVRGDRPWVPGERGGD